MSAKSVLLIGNFLSQRGGSRGVCEELQERLPGLGWNVYTASRHAAGVPRTMDMVRAAWHWRNEYAVAHVDVYSGFAFLWAEAVCAVLRRLRKPYILTLRGGNLPSYTRRWPQRSRRLLLSASRVTAPSRYLIEQLPVAGLRIAMVPNPLEIAHYPFRQRMQLRPQLIWVRALHRIYKPVMAVEILAGLVGRYPEASLTIVGPDKGDGAAAEVSRRAKELGIESQVHLVGGKPKAEIPQWLNRHDIFLNTTSIDNTPVSVMEAMACGLCVVSTNAGGVPYLLEDGVDGLLAPPGDIPALTAAVTSLMENAELAQRISRNGRTKVEAFDWGRVLPQWDEILERARATA